MTKIKYLIIILAIIFNNNLNADFWDDVAKPFKKAVEKIDDFFNDVSKNLEKHLNTKLTRKADYEARKLLLKGLKESADLTLKIAQEAVDITMTGAEATANAAVEAAKIFLKGLENVSAGSLEGAAVAARGIIEGVKQGAILSLEAGQYVVSNALNLIKINEISYSGKLSGLSQGKFGNIKVKGAIAGNAFPTLTLNLDVNDIAGSIVSVVSSLANSLKDLVNPFAQKAEIVKSDVSVAQKSINQPLPQEFSQLDKALDEVNKKLAEIKQEQEQMKLAYSKYFSQSIDVLAKTVKDAGICNGRDCVIARRVFVERAAEFDALHKELNELKTKVKIF